MIPERRRTLAAIAIAVIFGVSSGLWVWHLAVPGSVTDFDQLWMAARAVVDGADVYAAVGPGRAYPWNFPLYYPLPAAILVVPLAALPLGAARAVFFGTSTALLAFALRRSWRARWPLFLSGAFASAASTCQWSPLLTAAWLCPAALGFTLTGKPNVGLAMWASLSSRRAQVVAAIEVLVVVLLSLVLAPGWPAEWMAALRGAEHFTAPIARLGGPLLALAALRWRRPEARLLLLLSLVPQNPGGYEVLPLFLVVQAPVEGLALAVLTWLADRVTLALAVPMVAAHHLAPAAAGTQAAADVWRVVAVPAGRCLVWFCYLPCLVMVLRRPNESPPRSSRDVVRV